MVARTTATPRSKAGTSIAVIDYSAEIAALSARLQAPTGDRIKTSNAKVFILPDGSEHEILDVIVVDFVAHNRWYEGVFNEDNIVPPNCFAIGLEPSSLVPSDNSPDKQCDTCSGCWANQYKSAANKRGKACSNTRLLYLLVPPTGGVGVNDSLDDISRYTLSVSPTALTSFDDHVAKVVRSFGKPVRAVVTRMSFAEDSKWPSIRFTTVAPASGDIELYTNSLLTEARTRLMKEPDTSALTAANDTPAPAARRPTARARK